MTDAGLERAMRLTSLENIHLNNTRVTGTGLKHLTGLTRLKYVWLDDEQVDKLGLGHLQKLTLDQLLLIGPPLTEERRAELKQALPRTDIRRPW